MLCDRTGQRTAKLPETWLYFSRSVQPIYTKFSLFAKTQISLVKPRFWLCNVIASCENIQFYNAVVPNPKKSYELNKTTFVQTAL